MINFVLQYPLFYRLYQKIVRKKNHEYDFFKYIFSQISKNKKIKMLDLCSGDSFILDYVSEYIDDYVGLDNNEKYLKKLKKKWPKYTFLKKDITNLNHIQDLKNFEPNCIFMNGAIHHLDNKTMGSIISFINNYNDSIFLSVDPIKYNNKILNKIMIFLDRGKFIRDKKEYENLMVNYQHYVIDDFYKMSFQNMFHYKNVNLLDLYDSWKKTLNK
tara:strand:- start:776 stop:1420 length:645 start_codon:yes stop_codon:yes gene_type:complete